MNSTKNDFFTALLRYSLYLQLTVLQFYRTNLRQMKKVAFILLIRFINLNRFCSWNWVNPNLVTLVLLQNAILISRPFLMKAHSQVCLIMFEISIVLLSENSLSFEMRNTIIHIDILLFELWSNLNNMQFEPVYFNRAFLVIVICRTFNKAVNLRKIVVNIIFFSLFEMWSHKNVI